MNRCIMRKSLLLSFFPSLRETNTLLSRQHHPSLPAPRLLLPFRHLPHHLIAIKERMNRCIMRKSLLLSFFASLRETNTLLSRQHHLSLPAPHLLLPFRHLPHRLIAIKERMNRCIIRKSLLLSFFASLRETNTLLSRQHHPSLPAPHLLLPFRRLPHHLRQIHPEYW